MAREEHETVVVDSGGGSSAGMIAGILLAILVIGGLIWYFGARGGASGTVDVDVPAVSVNVKPDGQ